MISTKPYLIRAFYQWICDSDCTPYIVVNAEREGVHVPHEYIKDGKIIFNIATGTVHSLEITNDMISFQARFSGVLRQIYVPIKAVTAIYAKENGKGTVFEEQNEDDGNNEPPPVQPKKGKPTLKIVKNE